MDGPADTAPATPKIAAGQEVTFPAGTEPTGTAFTRLTVGNTTAPGNATIKTNKPAGGTALSTLNYLPSAIPFQNATVGNSTVALSQLNPEYPGVTVKASTEADIAAETLMVAKQGAIDTSKAGRKFDTRTSGTPVTGGTAYKYSTGAPNTTVFGNVTSTRSTANGWVVAYPCLQGRPNTSFVNYTQNVTKTNLTTGRTDANGDICFYTSTTTHLLWDEQGRTTNLTSTPTRLVDTRATKPAGYTYHINNPEILSVPTNEPAGTTVIGNLTVISPAPTNGVSVYTRHTQVDGGNKPTPAGYTTHLSSEANTDPIKNIFFIGKVDVDGQLRFYSTGAENSTVHYIVDKYTTIAPDAPQFVFPPEDTFVLSTAPGVSADAARAQTTWEGSNVYGNWFADTAFATGYDPTLKVKTRYGNISTIKNMQLGVLTMNIQNGERRDIYPRMYTPAKPSEPLITGYLYETTSEAGYGSLPPYPLAWGIWTPATNPHTFTGKVTDLQHNQGVLTVNTTTTEPGAYVQPTVRHYPAGATTVNPNE